MELFDEIYNNIDYISEGTTLEVLKTAFTDDFKETKLLIKVAQDYFKEGKYDNAIREAQKVKKLYSKIINRLTSLKDTAISNYTGFYAIFVHVYGTNFALCNTSMLHKLNINKDIREKVIKNKERIDKIKNDTKNAMLRKGDYKTWNNTKNATIQSLHLLSYEVDDFITICNEYKKNKIKPTKESMSSLFESIYNQL